MKAEDDMGATNDGVQDVLQEDYETDRTWNHKLACA